VGAEHQKVSARRRHRLHNDRARRAIADGALPIDRIRRKRQLFQRGFKESRDFRVGFLPIILSEFFALFRTQTGIDHAVIRNVVGVNDANARSRWRKNSQADRQNVVGGLICVDSENRPEVGALCRLSYDQNRTLRFSEHALGG
jgi:hypothetical protein